MGEEQLAGSDDVPQEDLEEGDSDIDITDVAAYAPYAHARSDLPRHEKLLVKKREAMQRSLANADFERYEEVKKAAEGLQQKVQLAKAPWTRDQPCSDLAHLNSVERNSRRKRLPLSRLARRQWS